MQTILVTGGAGYIGSVLLRNLLDEEYRVVCVDNLMFGGEALIDIWNNPHFQFYKCDINNRDDVDQILRKHNYYAVIHLAAIVGDPACRRKPELTEKTNWEASVNLLEKSMKNKIRRFIFASTCSNYGRMDGSNRYVDESSPLKPVSLYAELKVRFEDFILNQIGRREDFCPTILRFATVYGVSPRMRFDLTVNEFTKELALGRELVVFGEQFWRPYCHVADFSRAITTTLSAAEEKVWYKVFNVGDTGENYTKGMIIDEIRKQIPDCRIKHVEKKEDPRDYRVSFEKIKKELCFEISRTVPEGIREVKEIVGIGVIKDPDSQRYYNIPR